MRLNKKIVSAFFAGAFLIFGSGCAKSTQPDDFDARDGNAGFLASEVNDMGAASLGAMETGGAPKAAAAAPDTITLTYTRLAWHPSADSSMWLREAHVTYPSGVRDRYDTAYFYSASGSVVKDPRLATVDSIYHKRVVTRTFSGNTVESTLKMNIKLTKTAADTFAVKNGTIVGTYNGGTYRTVTVTNVKRERNNGRWDRVPVEGTILIDRDAILPRRARTITITFNGGETITAVVVRKSDGKTVTVVIVLSNGSES